MHKKENTESGDATAVNTVPKPEIIKVTIQKYDWGEDNNEANEANISPNIEDGLKSSPSVKIITVMKVLVP